MRKSFRIAALASALFVVATWSAQVYGASAKTVLFGAFGLEQKFDVSPGRFEKSKNFGGILTYQGFLGFQAFIGTATNTSFPSRQRFSLTLHYAPSLFDGVEPFFNFGPGYLGGVADGYRINFDLGLQIALGAYRIRGQHKAQLKS